jgi:hypothetical protein
VFGGFGAADADSGQCEGDARTRTSGPEVANTRYATRNAATPAAVTSSGPRCPNLSDSPPAENEVIVAATF